MADLTPNNRKEAWYSKMAGSDVVLSPQTREEAWFQEIADNSGGSSQEDKALKLNVVYSFTAPVWTVSLAEDSVSPADFTRETPIYVRITVPEAPESASSIVYEATAGINALAPGLVRAGLLIMPYANNLISHYLIKLAIRLDINNDEWGAPYVEYVDMYDLSSLKYEG